MVAVSFLYLYLSQYSHQEQVVGFESVTLVTVLGICAGIMYLCLTLAMNRIDRASGVLLFGLASGLVARVVLFASDPILENDYFRYLWDGGMLASGWNPYLWSPNDILSGAAAPAVQQLAEETNGLVAQIGYGDLRTIYPPVAVAIFAVAHYFDAWGLTGLRFLYLLADGAALTMLISVLRHLNMSPLWSLLYWLNPLAIQTIYNAMHMDVLLLPFIAGALLFAILRRPNLTALLMVLAAGVKLWPALLVPVLVSYAAQRRTEMLLAFAVFGAGFVLILLPFLLSGSADTSGLLAFSGEWRKNEVVFGLVVSLMETILQFLNSLRFDSERLARLAIAVGLGLIAIWPAKPRDEHSLIARLLILTVGLFVFAPAPYPWYFLWMLPLLTVKPVFALLVWTATLPLYQIRFHPHFIGDQALFENTVVWVEHGIPLVLLAATLTLGLVRR